MEPVDGSMPGGLKLAWYGDDFTGASDTLATVAEAGWRALLFLGVPSDAQLRDAGPLDAVGIAGAARSLAPRAMREALAPVARFFSACGAPVLHYKCCSTFDSAPGLGSIGAAVGALRGAAGDGPALIVGGQPSLGRYCVFGHLFATAAPAAPVHRIDRHPTMSRHPATPMGESDLRRHLARQGLDRVGLLDVRAHALSDAQCHAALEALMSESPDAVLLDVIDEVQLARVGRMLWTLALQSPRLCVGASSVAQAMLRHFGVRGSLAGRIAPARGPVLLLAGSLSPLTARQVAAARSYERVPLDAARLAAGEAAYGAAVAAQMERLLRDGRCVLAHTTPLGPAPAVATTSSAPLAAACGRLLADVLRRAPVTRLGVAGGDTSSLAMQALGATALEWIGRPAPGVALCRLIADAHHLQGMEVMLKGGQMGGDDLFENLVHGTP